ncbi:MAG: 16S rRNA (guanine(527)-N(7))-methyltransferase RsmG [Clostridia bacterium]|nr:16S rRNA (guanine(527)-N(7))-methyltransferase RsmG [Clostridia bacterium]
MKDIMDAAAAAGATLSEDAALKLEKYMTLLLEWNEKMNLTAITRRDEIIKKHFADSLSLLTAKIPRNARVIDIGAGAGLPSIPLAAARPDLDILMLDALGKRVRFLKECIFRLNLQSSALHARAEDAAKTQLRESFDVAVARAVAPMAVLAEYALPFVKMGGFFAAMKGGAPEEELAEAAEATELLGGKIEEIKRVELFDFLHTIVIVRKTSPTAAKYPRKAGKPEKEPLGASK